jgi:hypothetical protein
LSILPSIHFSFNSRVKTKYQKKMKSALVLLSLVAAIAAAPTQISENNVGNIITVGVNADVDVSSQVDVTVLAFLAALMNQQLTVANLGLAAPSEDEIPMAQPSNEIPIVNNEIPQQPQMPRLTPDMILKAKQYLENMKH